MAQLIHYAIQDCQACHERDQMLATAFALRFANGSERSKLLARKLELSVKRGELLQATSAMAWIIIDLELIVAGKLLLTLMRKE